MQEPAATAVGAASRTSGPAEPAATARATATGTAGSADTRTARASVRTTLPRLEVAAAELRAHLVQALTVDAAVFASEAFEHCRRQSSNLLICDRRQFFTRATAELLAKLREALRIHRRATFAHLRPEFGPAFWVHAAVRVADPFAHERRQAFHIGGSGDQAQAFG